MKEIITREGAQVAPFTLQDIHDETRRIASAQVPENTKLSYRADVEAWAGFCASMGFDATEPSEGALIAFLTAEAMQYKLNTVLRRRYGLRAYFKAAGLGDPFRTSEPLADFFEALKRDRATEPIDSPEPADLAIIGRLLWAADQTENKVKAGRDRALLLLAFAGGGLRRSEIAGLNINDVSFDSRGMKVVIRKSKTDQKGKGVTIGVEYARTGDICAVTAVRSWLGCLGDAGRLFRRVHRSGLIGKSIEGRNVTYIVKQLAQVAGLPAKVYSAHSLRHGFVTQASADGFSAQATAYQSRHASLAMIQHYMRGANPYDGGAQVIK